MVRRVNASWWVVGVVPLLGVACVQELPCPGTTEPVSFRFTGESAREVGAVVLTQGGRRIDVTADCAWDSATDAGEALVCSPEVGFFSGVALGVTIELPSGPVLRNVVLSDDGCGQTPNPVVVALP